RMVGADDERAVGLQELALQGDATEASTLVRDLTGGCQIAYHQRSAQKLTGKIAQLGMIALNQGLSKRYDAGVVWDERGFTAFSAGHAIVSFAHPERQETDTARKRHGALGHNLGQHVGIAHQKALRPITQGQVDQRSIFMADTE